MIAQCFGRLAQVAAGRVFKIQTHEVDDARTGFLQVGAQVLIAEIARNLNHAFGRVSGDLGQFLRAEQAGLNAKLQCFLEIGPGVVARDCCRRDWRRRLIGGDGGCLIRYRRNRVGGARHGVQIADSSSDSRAAGVAWPRSVSPVSTLPSSSSPAASSSARPRSWARALARSTVSISMNRSGNW